MFLHKEKINEKLSLSSIKTDKFKTSVLSVSITAPISKTAYAYNLLLSHILRRGTVSYPSVSLINKKLDELYGSYLEIKNHKIGENISLVILAEFLDSKYIPDGTDIVNEIIALISELILSPAFLEKDFPVSVFEHEKKIIIDTINSEINNTRLYAAKRCVEMINEGEVEIPSSAELKELISGATMHGLKEHYKALISTVPINIFSIGTENEAKIADTFNTAFSEYPCVPNASIIPPSPIQKRTSISKTESMPVSQGKLALAFTSGVTISNTDDRYYTMILLNEIFGGSASSKLFMNVREKLGICYYCSSSYSFYSGVMLVSSGFEVKNKDIAIKAIFEQLEDIKSKKISEYELYTAQRSLINTYRQLSDSPFDLQAFFGDRALFEISDGIKETEEKILKVTADDISELAKEIKLGASFFIEGTSQAKEDCDNE